MVKDQKAFFKLVLHILTAILLSILPLILVLTGAYFIALGSELFMAPLVRSENLPFELPSANNAYFGMLLVLLGFILAVFLIRKNRAISIYGWLIALFTQGVIVTFILTIMISPWFDLLILSFSFNKGACKTLSYLVESRTDEEYKANARKELDAFCSSAGKIFGHTYP